MQWSTALIPVLSQMESGVVVVRLGSRITSSGPLSGLWKVCLRCVVSSVAPAKLEYSPAERVVGILIMGIVGAWIVACWEGVTGSLERSVFVWTLLDRAFVFLNC